MNATNTSHPVRYPTLRSAVRLYLLVTVGTVAIVSGLSSAIDISFLRLAVAVFIVACFTMGAVLLTGVQPRTILGRTPSLIFLITGFLGGLAVFIPATWLLGLFGQTLGALYGNLPALVSGTEASRIGQGVLFGAVIPLCQGLLFFAFLQTAALGIGRWRAVWVVALLYGIYGIFSAGLGLSAGPGYFAVGLVAAALTYRSGSAWVGMLVISGFNLGEVILGDIVRGILLPTGDILSIQWLFAVLVSGFLSFAIVQVSRLYARLEPARPARTIEQGWRLPLLIVLLILIWFALNEVSLRRANAITPYTPPVTGSTSPPLSAPTPTLQPTKAADK